VEKIRYSGGKSERFYKSFTRKVCACVNLGIYFIYAEGLRRKGLSMIWKGFRFGMLLQLAVGPMCLLVFTTATAQGLFVGLSLVMAIALIDALYITLAGFGIAAFIGREGVKVVVKIFGGIVLILFGLTTILGIFHITILPDIKLFRQLTYHNLFLQGLILTASNPLTIIFWSGVFSSQVVERKLSKRQLFFFGLGCVLATLFFLSGVAILGSCISGFLPEIIIQLLNGAVGIVLIFFGIKSFFKK
jgi:threonine/homoserine/homoserine lactone efflux protein